MRSFLFLVFVLAASALDAQTRGTLRVTVVDPSGAVIVGAHVTIEPSTPGAHLTALDTGPRGEAAFDGLTPGRYALHVEAAGFEPTDVKDVRVRPGDNRREVKLPIAKLVERVDVGRDPRDTGLDRRGDAFATVLGQAEINELPDDPEEMEQAIRNMAGPGATIRINGFRGGHLPPKDQIAQIRFRRNMFAADAHEPGFMSVDIVTKPGIERWRGATTLGFRDAALNARNAFAPVKGDERHERYGLSLNGPIWAKHTSLAMSADGVDAFDSQTIVAALPGGRFADTVRKPTDSFNVTTRVEHALTPAQTIRAEFQRNHSTADNLGVGDFDLPERGYRQARTEQLFRLSASGSLRRSLFNEMRVQYRANDVALTPASSAPAVLVLNAFDAGGAQIDGRRTSGELELADDLDFALGKHAVRTGFLLERGRYRSDERRNAGGTFTFASLDAFAAGLPTTFTRNIGDPRVSVEQTELGVYVQDDFRARKDLTLSAGVRQEYQSTIGGWHLGPRGGFAWSPFKSGRTTIRGGGGLFFDWFDAASYEQAVQLDGTHQRIETIVGPGYPDATLGGRATVLPGGRITLSRPLTQPQIRESLVAVEQILPFEVRLNTMYVHRQGRYQLRGVNVNAPIGGVRPDPTAGAITEVRSTASSQFDALILNVNYANPARRIFVAANYSLARSINEADGPFGLPADSLNLAAERGPAPGDARHRFMSFANMPLGRAFRLGTSVRIQSALPYNITTGRDDNGDTVSNDRPAGVTRNSARGRATVDLGARVSWSHGFGTRPPGPQGPQVHIIRGGEADPLAGMSGASLANKRLGLELYAQAYNLLNHMNALRFSGVATSPFFGQPIAAAPARRAEVGARVTF